MTATHIDFETRSPVELTTHGLPRYAEHPKTEVLCCAIAEGDAAPGLWAGKAEALPRAFSDGRTLHAWNAAFERTILREVLGVDTKREQWRCTAAMAAYAGLPRSLAGASSALNLGGEGKSKEGQKVMRLMCKPSPDTGEYVFNGELFGKLQAYCQQDVVAERAIARLLPGFPEVEQRNYEVDRWINERGVPIDRVLCERAVQIIEEASAKSRGQAEAISEGAILTPNQIAKILEFVTSRGVNIGDLRAPTVEAALADPSIDSDARAMLELRSSVASAAVKKFKAALDTVSEDGRVRECFKFYGARTGRTAGVGLQMQNFKRGVKLTPEVIDAIRLGSLEFVQLMFATPPIPLLGQHIRALVCAPPGRTFVLCDYEQIECRVVHWLAGDTETLEVFRAGRDVYKEFGAKIYGVPAAEVTGERRQISKCACLGLSYGLGAKRFVDFLAGFGTQIDEEFAKKVVGTYRSVNSKIPALWRGLERAAIMATQHGRASFRGVEFRLEGKWLSMGMPNGLRKVYYHRPELVHGMYGPVLEYNDARGNRETSWGGLLTENLVQAASRDILFDALHNCQQEGLDVVLHVHDEIGVECDEGEAEHVKQKLEEIMCHSSPWTKGLPIGVQAGIKKRFEK